MKTSNRTTIASTFTSTKTRTTQTVKANQVVVAAVVVAETATY